MQSNGFAFRRMSVHVPKGWGYAGAEFLQTLKLAPSERLELPTPSLGRRCSIQLNYEGNDE